MASAAQLTHVIRHLPAADSDPALLARYCSGDPAAFESLLHRYGPMVLGVARRQLPDPHGADDVFQATFLALARSAAKLGRRPVLANWLYTVALRQARKARGRSARLQPLDREPQFAGPDPLAEITARELLQIVDDELVRLPDGLRLPVLLCCVQGLSRDEAARELGWSFGAVKGRLERGRRRLAERLAHRGLAPFALLLAPFATISIPAVLIARAVAQAAAPWAKSIPSEVAALASSASSRSVLPPAALACGFLIAALAGLVVASGDPKETLSVAAPAAQPATAADRIPEDPLPNGSILRFGTPRYRHTSRIEELAVTPDGKFAVACSGTLFTGSVRAYDLATGRVQWTFEAGEVQGVAFSPDGRTLATRTYGGAGAYAVHLFDMTNGKQTGKIPLSSHIRVLLFAPDGKHVFVAGDEGKSMQMLRISDGGAARTFENAKTAFAAALSPDGKRLVVGGFDYEKSVDFARIWDVESGKELAPLPLDRGMRSAAFSADSRTIALGGESGRTPSVLLIDAATGKQRLKIPYPEPGLVRSVAFAPDGRTIAASAGGTVRLFDTDTGKERVKIDRRGSGLQFSPDGSVLIGAATGTIFRWDAATGRSLIPDCGESPVGQIALSKDGKRIVSRGHDGDAHVWDPKTGAHLRSVRVSWQRGVALSPDGRFLVWPEADESIKFKDPLRPNEIQSGSRLRMMDLDTGMLVERFEGTESSPSNLEFIDGGKRLVTVERFRRQAGIRVWNVATGKVERTIPGAWKETGQVWDSRLSPDEKTVAVRYQDYPTSGIRVDSTVKLFDLASGKELNDPAPAWSSPNVMAFSPDGRTMAVVRGHGPIEIQDADSGRALGEVLNTKDRVTALAFGSDGRLFTGFDNATILVWDAKTVQPAAGH